MRHQRRHHDSFGDEDGWISLGLLGDQLGKRLPDFDVRNYGYKRLRPF
ncbi:MAG: OST-HTH/LOTUS domain-containing protein [Collinsella sp.]